MNSTRMFDSPVVKKKIRLSAVTSHKRMNSQIEPQKSQPEILPTLTEKKEKKAFNGLSSIIDDENRMFKLRQKRRRNGIGGIILPSGSRVKSQMNKKHKLASLREKRKNFGRQNTLLKELKALEQLGKKKMNNLAKRDNERAIQMLRK